MTEDAHYIAATTRSPSGRWMESSGQIEGMSLVGDGRVKIDGWAGSSRSGATAFRVWCGERELAIDAVELGLPNPGVAKFVPRLANAASAGFRIFAEIGAADAVAGRLFRVTPTFGDEIGLDLLGVAVPAIAPPSADELALVSKNISIAWEFLGYFQELCGLPSNARVLDVGCGVGRMAWALAHHITQDGSYDGFDVVKRFVELATERFRALPNFRFRHVDVANGEFNPAGGMIASDLHFPYADASFDFVFLASVFTHMQPAEVRHYIDEIRRVLAPGCRCLVSAFLVSPEAADLVARGEALLPLRANDQGFFVNDSRNPEAAIGYEEAEFFGWWRKRGFRVEHLVRGSWCGRTRFASYQDIAVLTRDGRA